MTGLRTLVFGASWCDTEEKRELCKLWARSMEKIAPECDILVIDCNSPFRPGAFLKPLGYIEAAVSPLCFPRNSGNRVASSFADNIGHLSLGGQDGWGRSFCKGLEIAIAAKYDYVVYIEPDLLFAPKVMPIIEKMHRAGVKAACPIDFCYHFINNEIMFLNVDYIRDIDFVGKYDWQNPPPPPFDIVPERRCEKILADELFILSLRGARNDFHNITVGNLEQAFPLGVDWITHCRDFAIYETFARMKGLIDE